MKWEKLLEFDNMENPVHQNINVQNNYYFGKDEKIIFQLNFNNIFEYPTIYGDICPNINVNNNIFNIIKLTRVELFNLVLENDGLHFLNNNMLKNAIFNGKVVNGCVIKGRDNGFYFIYKDGEHFDIFVEKVKGGAGSPRQPRIEIVDKTDELLEFLCKDDVDFRNLVEHINNNAFTIIRGAVQSGKSRSIYKASIYFSYVYGITPIIILEATNKHLEDFTNKSKHYLKKLNKELKIKFSINTYNDLDFVNDRSIIIAINNYVGLKKIEKYIKKNKLEYGLFIDEADKTVYGGDELTKARMLCNNLISRSKKRVYVSATTFGLLENEEVMVKNIFHLTKHPKYKGIHELTYKILKSNVTKKQNWERMSRFVKKLSKHRGYGDHPMIALMVFSHKKEDHVKFIDECMKHNKNCDFLAFNSTKKDGYYYNGQYIKKSLNMIIQDQKRPLFIIAGRLADRGISYVSRDFKKHLTHQYLYVSDSTSTTTCEQYLRIMGIYSDNIELTVYMTEETKNDIFKSHEVTKDIAENSNHGQPINQQLIENGVHREKMPKRKITNTSKKHVKLVNKPDGRLPLIEFKKNIGEEEKKNDDDVHNDLSAEFKRLIKLFPKWSENREDQKIGRFMNDLDPDYLYSEDEMKELCLQHDNIVLKNITTLGKRNGKGGGNTYGLIMKKIDGGYKLYDELVEPFKRHFNWQKE